MLTSLRDVVRRRRGLASISAVGYLGLYLIAIQNVSPGGRGFDVRTTDWQRMFEPITSVTFEPVLQITLPGLTFLVSPLNLLIGSALALAIAVGVAVTRELATSESPGVSPVFVAIPTATAALACVAPGLMIVLALPIPSGFVAIFQILIPISLLALIGAVAVTLRRMA